MPKERPARSKVYSAGPAPTGAAGGLGQHFIKNIAVVNNIVEKAGIKPTDIVLEIGPGNGILTMELLKKAKKGDCSGARPAHGQRNPEKGPGNVRLVDGGDSQRVCDTFADYSR